ncbi:hypothetical protein NG697_12495 [Pseudarthrobacter sp. MDT3-26]|uniref:hypothetical protein n=1 Tax=Pseudarthrobacter raffinosi TaxID=2953651 RepID=UPI00208F6BBB|nr:hypothetical protein [Pseudarthrobacter sp. MDT3-26]MCO4263731.1 hypothetical protein [Pseudarthrobacter sp. MDT3-26]
MAIENFKVDEDWFGTMWDPLRDEYGYPINSALPAGLYVDHQGIVAKRWHPEAGKWIAFHDLTVTPLTALREQIRREPPELPFEALDFETRKAIRKQRSRGQIRPSAKALPARLDPTGAGRRQREKTTIRNRNIGGSIAAASALLIAGSFIFSSANGSADTGNKYGAQSACEDGAKARLKSPSSAKFSNMRYTEKGSSYTIRLDVDAQNSFGAALRNTVTCEVTWTGSRYRLENLAGL